MNAIKTDELSVIARSAEIAISALVALKKGVNDLLGSSDMNILVQNDEKITDRQKTFLTSLVRKNIIDPGERENKLAEMESYSRGDANLAIKGLLGG